MSDAPMDPMEQTEQPQGVPPSRSYFGWSLLGIALIVGVVFLIGKLQTKPAGGTGDADAWLYPEGKTGTTVAATPEPVEETPASAFTPPTEAEIASAKAAGTRRATIKTDKGDIVVELYGKEAPLTVANFVKLAKADFYDKLTFHRVEPGFVIQGGDPDGNGTGGPGYSIKLEIAPKLRHVKGALAMARSNDPDSAGSQFYITLDKADFLDDQYAVFGTVVGGEDVPAKIRIGDHIKDVVLQ